MEHKITNRNIVEWRFSTCPADFGYDGLKTSWKTEPACVRSTVKSITEKIRKKKIEIGLFGGLMYAEDFRLISAPNIKSGDVRDLISDFETWAK
jgi:hypothetical protein